MFTPCGECKADPESFYRALDLLLARYVQSGAHDYQPATHTLVARTADVASKVKQALAMAAMSVTRCEDDGTGLVIWHYERRFTRSEPMSFTLRLEPWNRSEYDALLWFAGQRSAGGINALHGRSLIPMVWYVAVAPTREALEVAVAKAAVVEGRSIKREDLVIYRVPPALSKDTMDALNILFQ